MQTQTSYSIIILDHNFAFFISGAKIAVFTYHGATVEVQGNLEVEPYSSKGRNQ